VVGDHYWSAETLPLLAEHYPGIDAVPYAARPRL
jgi:hypothetical protein